MLILGLNGDFYAFVLEPQGSIAHQTELESTINGAVKAFGSKKKVFAFSWTENVFACAFENGVIGFWTIHATESELLGSITVNIGVKAVVDEMQLHFTAEGVFNLLVKTSYGGIALLSFQIIDKALTVRKWECIRQSEEFPQQVSALTLIPDRPNDVLCIGYSTPFFVHFAHLHGLYDNDVLMDQNYSMTEQTVEPLAMLPLPGMAASSLVFIHPSGGFICTPDGYLGSFVLQDGTANWTSDAESIHKTLLDHGRTTEETIDTNDADKNETDDENEAGNDEEENSIQDQVIQFGSTVGSVVGPIHVEKQLLEFYGAVLSPNSLFIGLHYRHKSPVFRARSERANISFVEWIAVPGMGVTSQLLSDKCSTVDCERIWDIVLGAKETKMMRQFIEMLAEKLDEEANMHTLRALYVALLNCDDCASKTQFVHHFLCQIYQTGNWESLGNGFSWKTFIERPSVEKPSVNAALVDADCIACQSPLVLQKYYVARCEKNHKWPVCPLTHRVLVDPFTSFRCEYCDSLFSMQVLEKCKRCWFCANQINAEFK